MICVRVFHEDKEVLPARQYANGDALGDALDTLFEPGPTTLSLPTTLRLQFLYPDGTIVKEETLRVSATAP